MNEIGKCLKRKLHKQQNCWNIILAWFWSPKDSARHLTSLMTHTRHRITSCDKEKSKNMLSVNLTQKKLSKVILNVLIDLNKTWRQDLLNKNIVNLGEWFWNTSEFYCMFLFPLWPWLCTKHNCSYWLRN